MTTTIPVSAPDLPPAFEGAHPPGWLVYHPHLGVVPKRQAEEYNNNTGEAAEQDDSDDDDEVRKHGGGGTASEPASGTANGGDLAKTPLATTTTASDHEGEL